MKKIITWLALGAAAYEIYIHHISKSGKEEAKEMIGNKGKMKEKWSDTKEKVKDKLINMIDEM